MSLRPINLSPSTDNSVVTIAYFGGSGMTGPNMLLTQTPYSTPRHTQ